MDTQTVTTGHPTQYVTEALGDFADDYDIPAIVHEIFDWDDHQDLYVMNVTPDDFWTVAAAHDTTKA